LVAADIYADASDQAVPFAGDETASDRAWAARVDEAVQAMDVLDPPGLDRWMSAHAASMEPQVDEAGLVAAWETWLRAEYAPEALGDVTDLTTLTTGSGDLVDEWDDAAGWP